MSLPADIPPPRRQPRESRTERRVVAFVLVALATLVAVPILVDQRVRGQREEIAAAEAARRLVTRLQFNLVQEMGALSELMLTRDTTAHSDYHEALLRQNSIFEELEAHTRGLGPEVTARFQEVRRQARIWHERAVDPEDLLEDFGGPQETRPRRERRLFQELLATAAELDAAILDRTVEISSQIAAAERLGLALSFGLGCLALIAGAAATLLAGRSRRFAAESERRRIEAERALEELAREADLRERLLQGITHDVKNPLGAAKGFAELLALGIKAPILPEQVPLVAGVQRSVDGALEIIADLLDVARADSGRLSIQRLETDLAAVVEAAVEDHRPQAETAGHTIRFEAPAGPVRVHTDPARVRQILQNLLSNAVKYTPAPGCITVGAEIGRNVEDTPDRKWGIVRVSDTGPGIPPELRERVFDEFTRVDDREGIPGHGLGLAIARRVARLLGGDLRVEEAQGPGATFVLLVPVRDPVDAATRRA